MYPNRISIIRDESTLESSVNMKQLEKHMKSRAVTWSLLGSLKKSELQNVQELHVLGTGDSRIKKPKGLLQGCYRSADGTWLLLVGATPSQIRSMVTFSGRSLQTLDIRFSDLDKLELHNTENLQDLLIRSNSRLHSVPGIRGHKKLRRLILSQNEVIEPLDISGCDNLEELNIADSGIYEITADAPLPRLRMVYARNTPISSAGFVHLLPALKVLNLSLTEVECMPCLDRNPRLQTLILYGTKLKKLPSLCKLTALETVNLSKTEISELGDDSFPTDIKNLLLSELPIRRLPSSIQRMHHLLKLELSGLQLDELPEWLPALGLQFSWDTAGNGICLKGTSIKGVDMSIFDQPQEAILQWFENRRKLAENETVPQPLREMKIVFLGDGEAGKSHTIARLLRNGEQAVDFPGVSTPGIVIDDKTYNIDGKEIKVHFWDFGGQEILHSMHRMFLTERTLYVVVLNVREGNQQERARYWLHNLRSFANGAAVLLVLNKMDMNKNASVNESDLRAMYPGLTEVVKLSAKEDSKKEFENKFLAALRRQIGGFEYLESPFLPAWSRLKDELQGMQTSYIRGAQFRQFCDKCGVKGSDDVRRGLLNWFSDLGVSFCYSDSRELEDYVVLRPDWITNAIYLLLFNQIRKITNGLVTHDTIYEMLRSPDNARTLPGAAYTRDEVEYVLNVFRKFRLSFRVEEGVEFLPMLCDANSTPAAEEYAADPGALEFRMIYEYLPNNVLHRLMVERRRDLDLQNVWLTGARFVYGKTGLSAVVKSEGNLLRILVRAGESAYEPQRYLDLLKGDLERINEIMGLTVAGTEMVYKHDGLAEAFDYDQLMSFLDAGLTHMASKKTKRPVPIREILKQSDYPEDENQKKLIEDVRRACEKLQGNKKFWNSLEDERTDYLRDLLQMTERYTVLDQHRGGVSAGGERAGSLDLDIRLEANACWTVLEALNLKSSIPSQIRYWDAHLDKLLDNYNPEGRSFLFHVSYVGCPKTDFNKICSDLYDHLRWYSPDLFEVIPRTAREVPLAQSPEHQHRFMRMFKCVYDCGGAPMTVYHYFVRIGEDIP